MSRDLSKNKSSVEKYAEETKKKGLRVSQNDFFGDCYQMTKNKALIDFADFMTEKEFEQMLKRIAETKVSEVM